SSEQRDGLLVRASFQHLHSTGVAQALGALLLELPQQALDPATQLERWGALQHLAQRRRGTLRQPLKLLASAFPHRVFITFEIVDKLSRARPVGDNHGTQLLAQPGYAALRSNGEDYRGPKRRFGVEAGQVIPCPREFCSRRYLAALAERGQVPDQGSRIRAAGDQPATVRRERHRGRRRPVTVQDDALPAGRQFPDA